MKRALAAVIRITVVLFVGATLSMQHDTFASRVGCATANGAAPTASVVAN